MKKDLDFARSVIEEARVVGSVFLGGGLFLQTGDDIGCDGYKGDDVYLTTDNGIEPELIDAYSLLEVGMESLGWDEEGETE